MCYLRSVLVSLTLLSTIAQGLEIVKLVEYDFSNVELMGKESFTVPPIETYKGITAYPITPSDTLMTATAKHDKAVPIRQGETHFTSTMLKARYGKGSPIKVNFFTDKLPPQGFVFHGWGPSIHEGARDTYVEFAIEPKGFDEIIIPLAILYEIVRRCDYTSISVYPKKGESYAIPGTGGGPLHWRFYTADDDVPEKDRQYLSVCTEPSKGSHCVIDKKAHFDLPPSHKHLREGGSPPNQWPYGAFADPALYPENPMLVGGDIRRVFRLYAKGGLREWAGPIGRMRLFGLVLTLAEAKNLRKNTINMNNLISDWIAKTVRPHLESTPCKIDDCTVDGFAQRMNDFSLASSMFPASAAIEISKILTTAKIERAKAAKRKTPREEDKRMPSSSIPVPTASPAAANSTSSPATIGTTGRPGTPLVVRGPITGIGPSAIDTSK